MKPGPFFACYFAALALASSLGCSSTGGTDSGNELRTAVQAGPKLANAAAQAQKVEIGKPAPSLPLISDLADVVLASTQTAGVKESETIQKLVSKVLTLKDVLLKAEKAKEDGDAALAAANKRIEELEASLNAANRRPIYWVAAIVGGVLVAAGAVVCAFGAQLGIAGGMVKGGALVSAGGATLALMVVVDSILDSAQLAVALWILVAALALAVAYLFRRWIVQGKTLATAVAETDKLLSKVEPELAGEFLNSSGRAMDTVHKRVIQIVRAAAPEKSEESKK